MEERRAAFRYKLSFPVVVRGMPGVYELEPLYGRTSNISTQGVHFTIDRVIEPGTELRISITLPREITQELQVSIDAQVKVVRAGEEGETAAEGVGLAALIEEYRFVRAKSVAP
jgi:PilZ domain-containing protein